MRGVSFLAIVAVALVAIVYIHRTTEVQTVYKTRTVTVHRTVTKTRTVDKIAPQTRVVTLHHEADPVPGTMSVREFNSIRNGMTDTYVNRMFGDSYANRDGDYRDVWPAEGGGWFVVYYDHRHDHFVVGKGWHE